jgi:predicted nucleotidyltransferase
MEADTGQNFDSDPLLPVRLRLDGLVTRLDRIDQDLEEAMSEVPVDLRRSIEINRLHMGLRGVELGFSGLIKALCLALDGTVPDEGDWYPEALAQLAGTGRGRAPVLSPELILHLHDLREEFPDIPVTDPDERLRLLHARRDAARAAYPLLLGAVGALDGRFSAAPPDPDLLAAEPGRLERAAARKGAMGRAAAAISEAFAARGRRAVPFGSVLEGPVHGRSDLDMVVPGEMGMEERGVLWRMADEIAAAEGVGLDLHFEHLYGEGFLDELKTIHDGQILTLRELIETGRDPETPGL